MTILGAQLGQVLSPSGHTTSTRSSTTKVSSSSLDQARPYAAMLSLPELGQPCLISTMLLPKMVALL